jgi:hypothetical protein
MEEDRMNDLTQWVTLSEHILGSLAETHLLNPTVMVHTTVSPVLYHHLFGLIVSWRI